MYIDILDIRACCGQKTGICWSQNQKLYCPVSTQRMTTLKELIGLTKVIARVQDTLSHPELTIHKDRSYKRNCAESIILKLFIISDSSLV